VGCVSSCWRSHRICVLRVNGDRCPWAAQPLLRADDTSAKSSSMPAKTTCRSCSRTTWSKQAASAPRPSSQPAGTCCGHYVGIAAFIRAAQATQAVHRHQAAPCREALTLYRDILRYSNLFVWKDASGRVWRDVIRASARKVCVCATQCTRYVVGTLLGS
jgi:hypothetical protein